MRVAYLILCHIDPGHIKRLVTKITKGTNDMAFVHVDGKCDRESFQKELENNPRVQFIEERVRIHWGGYSSVEATINLFRAALSFGGAKV